MTDIQTHVPTSKLIRKKSIRYQEIDQAILGCIINDPAGRMANGIN